MSLYVKLLVNTKLNVTTHTQPLKPEAGVVSSCLYDYWVNKQMVISNIISLRDLSRVSARLNNATHFNTVAQSFHGGEGLHLAEGNPFSSAATVPKWEEAVLRNRQESVWEKNSRKKNPTSPVDLADWSQRTLGCWEKCKSQSGKWERAGCKYWVENLADCSTYFKSKMSLKTLFRWREWVQLVLTGNKTNILAKILSFWQSWWKCGRKWKLF